MREELEILLREEGLDPEDAREAATGAAMFALGVIKGRVARVALLRSGLQVLLVGGASAGVGCLIGTLGPSLFGAG